MTIREQVDAAPGPQEAVQAIASALDGIVAKLAEIESKPRSNSWGRWLTPAEIAKVNG
jgi:hypothetical protein